MDFFLEPDKKLKQSKLKKTQKGEWIEESFGKYSWREKGKKFSAPFLGIGVSKFKFLLIRLGIFAIIAVLFGKAFYLQIAQGAKYKNMAEINRIRQVPIVAKRGIIYDRNKKSLVSNVPNFYLAISPNDMPEDEQKRATFLDKLSQVIGILPSDIEEQLITFSPYNFQSVPIKTSITYKTALELEILNNTYPAIQVKIGSERKYDAPKSMSHILGYLRRVDKNDLQVHEDYLLTDSIGKSGIEYQYEKALRGIYGKKQIEVDALGRQSVILAKEDPSPGDDIILTIDAALQERVEGILKKHLRAHKKSRASVIISDTSSGEILSMVSLPVFDNNIFSGELSVETYSNLLNDKNKPFLNRAISGEYPSGSIVKPIVALAGLEEELINEYTSFISRGGIRINQWFFPDWKVGGHGITNVKKALAESVNTFFYIVGGGLLDDSLKNFEIEGLGVAKLVEYAKKFYLSKKLGIDIPAEASGFLPSKQWKEKAKGEPWYIGDTYHLAIGQGDILVTPLQANFWTLAIANGGKLYRPHLVKTILHSSGDVKTFSPQALNQDFIKKENIDIVKAGLRDGVLYGSSKNLLNLNVRVAGKTGTAQWGSKKTPHAWFTGFAPYNDPEIAITVLVEEGGEGSQVAVPIAKEILWWYFNS